MHLQDMLHDAKEKFFYDNCSWATFCLCVLLAIDYSHSQLSAIYSMNFSLALSVLELDSTYTTIPAQAATWPESVFTDLTGHLSTTLEEERMHPYSYVLKWSKRIKFNEVYPLIASFGHL